MILDAFGTIFLFLLAVLVAAAVCATVVCAVVIRKVEGETKVPGDAPYLYNWVDTSDDPNERGVYATSFRNQPRCDDVFVMDNGRVMHIDTVDTRARYLECHELEIDDVHGGDNSR